MASSNPHRSALLAYEVESRDDWALSEEKVPESKPQPGGQFTRVGAGEGPFHLQAIDAWVFAVDEGRRLRFANDREGTRWWHTAEEAELEAARAAEAQTAAALARVAELEAKLRLPST